MASAALLCACATSSTPLSPSVGVRPTAVYLMRTQGVSLRRIELRVDGVIRAATNQGWVEIPPMDLTAGDHLVDLRLLLPAAGAEGQTVVWSTTQGFDVPGGPEGSEPRSPTLTIELALQPGAAPLSQRLEARFRVHDVRLLAGAVPRVEPATTFREPEYSLARRGEEVVADPVADANQKLAAMDAAIARVRDLIAAAKADKDLIRVLCIEGKTTELESARRSAGERSAALRVARDLADDAAVNRESDALLLWKHRVDALVAEAEACVGESRYRGGAD